MKLLAIETATEACSAALRVDGETLSRFEVAPRRHAELILPMCDALLAEAGLSLASLDAVAYGRGPGSFTGVRLAAAMIQGMAYGHALPVVPVSTLAAIAQEAVAIGHQQRILVAIDARMQEVYWGCYESDAAGMARLLGEEAVLAPAAVVPLPRDSGWYGAGSGWQTYGEIFQARLDSRVEIYDGAALPKAEFISVLAEKAFFEGRAIDAADALPVYLRDNVAHQPARS